MKIVLLMDSPLLPTGYGSTCRLTARELIKRGYQVYAVAFNGGPQEQQEWFGIKIIPNDALKRDPNAIYGDLPTIKKVVSEVDPDVMLFHNDSYRYGYLKDVNDPDIFERSVFWLPFEGENPDLLGVQLFHKFAATRFVTQYAMGVHAKLLENKNIGYVPHAIDLDSMIPCPNKTEAKARHVGTRLSKKGISRDPTRQFVACRVDRHQPRKYWDLTLKAFAQFAHDKDDVFLLCKCNPRDCTMWDEANKKGLDLEVLAESLGIKDKIAFDDFFFNAPNLAESFYWPSDVFLTTTSGEGYGLALAESMACGLPVIYPDTPVLPEVVGDAGLKCRLAGKEWYDKLQVSHNIVDVKDVAAKLEWAYQDWKAGGGKLAEMGLKARARVEANYAPKVVYEQWDKVLQEVGENKSLVSLITVLYNVTGKDQIEGEDGVERLRQSIEAHVKHPYEWIIVDNGSPARDETRTWLSEAAKANPRIKPLLLDNDLGFAGANNAAIALSKGKQVVLVNPDSEAIDPDKHGLAKDFVALLAERANSDHNVGVVGMALNQRDDVLPGLKFPYFCCALVTRECIEAIRLPNGNVFDENFWNGYYEDADLCIRAMAKGFKVVEANVPFWHKSGGTNKHMIEGGKDGPHVKALLEAADKLSRLKPGMADWPRKRGELLAGGMQGVISGNIAYLNKKWGLEARSRIKVVWNTHVGAAVGFSELAEGLVPELHELGFDVYVNDWSNGAKITNPLIRQLWEKTVRAKQEGDSLEGAINIVCWLMETFLDVDADYKVGISLCESTKVRESYLAACNSMDRILTFSEFCRRVQKDSGYRLPIHVIPPGVDPIYLTLVDRPSRDKFTFLSVGVSQERKDTRRLVDAFCEAFPRDKKKPPDSPDCPFDCDQVELVLKSNNFGDLEWVERDGFSKRANIRAIFTGWDKRAQRGDFSKKEMLDLYSQADCLVHPAHGEGIGQPLLESAATGLPIIFTNWSSPSEYFNDSNSYPCSLSPYPGTTFTKAYPGAPGDNGVWGNCSIGHLKHLMFHVIRNRDEARAKGKAAHEHMKAHHAWKESAARLWPLLFDWDEERKGKASREAFSPLTFAKPVLDPIRKGDRVCVDVVSRDRHSYLSALIVSLLGQAFRDWDLIVQDDDADESMIHDHQIMTLCKRMNDEGHQWRIIRGHRQGPHVAHDRTLRMAHENPGYRYKLICRIDDDIYIRPDYLEKLFSAFLEDKDAEVAAVSGVYPDPGRPLAQQIAPQGFEKDLNYAGKIDHNVPWPYVCLYPPGTRPRLVEHLYSSFMFRVELGVAVGGYCRLFSQIGHREESDFSHRFSLAGYKLLIHPEAIGFHFQAPGGGIRSGDIVDRAKLAESDHRIYSRRLAKWKKQADERRQLDAKRSMSAIQAIQGGLVPPFAASPKVNVIINGGKDIARLRGAIERFAPWAHEMHVCCDASCLDASPPISSHPKAKTVATTPEEASFLACRLLTEGSHEFLMTVKDSTRFMGNPLALLDDQHDDYVFEAYSSYVPPVEEHDPDEVFIGPEARNECLITRRRSAGATPSMDRILYSDIMVIEDERLNQPKSTTGRDLLPLSEINKRGWTKVCAYQFPEGRLDPPREARMGEAAPWASIIIPTTGRVALLRKCLDSIYSNTSTPFEVLVVDNASADGTAEFLAGQEKLRPSLRSLRQPANLGYQKSVNLAVSRARGEYLLLFNDDAWVESREPDGRDWVRALMDELTANPKAGLVGPHGGTSPALGGRMLYFWCVMLRRSLFQEVGPLDDVTFFNYGGDDDYCERVRRAGYEIVEKPVRLRHLMNCVPEEVKRPELERSVIKLLTKYAKQEPGPSS